MTPFVVSILLLTGIFVGLMAGLLGIGGGVLIVPLLSYVLVSYLDVSSQHAIHVAIATSLSTIVFTGLSSARAHFKLGNINTKILLYCGIGVAVGAIIGAQLAVFIDGKNLTLVFSILLIGIAANMLLGSIKVTKSEPRELSLLGAGTLTGGLSAVMGIGGGAILVPLLCYAGVTLRTAIGSAAACGLVIAIFGTASFMLSDIQINLPTAQTIGLVFWPATLCISATSMIFAPFGAKLGQSVNTQVLKKLFALFLLFVSAKMIWSFI